MNIFKNQMKTFRNRESLQCDSHMRFALLSVYSTKQGVYSIFDHTSDSVYLVILQDNSINIFQRLAPFIQRILFPLEF